MADNIDGLSVAINTAIVTALKELHTALPGKIVSFDPDTQLAAVQPTIKRIYVTRSAEGETRTAIDLPQLINVPVCFPQAGGFSLTFPVEEGDECLLVFCERSIDLWWDYGDVQNPGAKRFHSLSDAIAVLGISSKSNVVSDYSEDEIQLRNEYASSVISIDGAGAIRVDAGSGTLTLKAADIVLDGDVSSTGTFTNNGVNIGSTHIHPQGNDSDGDVQVPTGPPQ